MISKYAYLLLILSFLGCGTQSGKESKTDDVSEASSSSVKNVNDLDYEQVVAMVLADTSNLGEWHNSPIETVANKDLTLAMGDPCGENNCGKEVLLTNSGTQLIMATISTVYSLEESPWQIAQELKIAAGSTISLGCSHLCYGTSSLSFDRKVEGSVYLQE